MGARARFAWAYQTTGGETNQPNSLIPTLLPGGGRVL